MNENNDNKMTAEEKALTLRDGTENMRDPAKRREIIKTILIIFLAAMLVLTFFSNTIMNKSLAEISMESTTSGKLTERIRGSGMVEANQLYEVKTDGNRIVDTIFIRAGQQVEKDEVLFTVGTGESQELTDAEAMLAALQLDYQKALLVLPADYSSENQAIKNAQEDLNDAIAKRDSAALNQQSAQDALDRYNQNKISLDQKITAQSKLQSTISAIDMDDYSAAAVEYTGTLITLYNAYTSAESDYNDAYVLYNQLVSDGADAESAKADADAKKVLMESAWSVYSSEKMSVRDSLVSQLMTTESDITNLNSAIASYESSASGGEQMSLEALDADVTAKQRILEDLIIALEKTKKENSVNEQIAGLDLEAKKAEIEKQQAKVDALKTECQTTEIKSEYAGVVSSVNIQPGEMTVPDMAMAVIDISSAGYRVQISVDGEKAKQIKSGVKAEVVNNWSGDVQAVLTEIKNDTVSGSKNRILVFEVTGDVDSGTYVDLSIPCGSGTYDVIVPKSAVYEDANGKFVLTVKSKSSPLGNRYYAERVNVEVVSSDEISSAVSGALESGAYVITAASKPVSPGDQVRMND